MAGAGHDPAFMRHWHARLAAHCTPLWGDAVRPGAAPPIVPYCTPRPGAQASHAGGRLSGAALAQQHEAAPPCDAAAARGAAPSVARFWDTPAGGAANRAPPWRAGRTPRWTGHCNPWARACAPWGEAVGEAVEAAQAVGQAREPASAAGAEAPAAARTASSLGPPAAAEAGLRPMPARCVGCLGQGTGAAARPGAPPRPRRGTRWLAPWALAWPRAAPPPARQRARPGR